MKIGLLTYFHGNNAGLYYQALATLDTLAAVFPGDQIELINIRNFGAPTWMPPKSFSRLIPSLFRHLKFNAARRRRLSKYLGRVRFNWLSSRAVESYLNSNHFDVVITGADVCLKVSDACRGVLPPYWIPAGVKAKKYILSGSAENTIVSDLNSQQLAEAVASIENISLIFVRDTMTANLLSTIAPSIKDRIAQIPDPTFVLPLSSKQYTHIDKEKRRREKKVCMVNLVRSDFTQSLIASLREKYCVFSMDRRASAGEPVLYVGPEEWLAMWNSIDYLVTDSFHQSLFSIRTRTSFVGIDIDRTRIGRSGGDSKVGNLLKCAHLDELYFSRPKTSEIGVILDRLEGARKLFDLADAQGFCERSALNYTDAVHRIRADVFGG